MGHQGRLLSSLVLMYLIERFAAVVDAAACMIMFVSFLMMVDCITKLQQTLTLVLLSQISLIHTLLPMSSSGPLWLPWCFQ